MGSSGEAGAWCGKGWRLDAAGGFPAGGVCLSKSVQECRDRDGLCYVQRALADRSVEMQVCSRPGYIRRRLNTLAPGEGSAPGAGQLGGQEKAGNSRQSCENVFIFLRDRDEE